MTIKEFADAIGVSPTTVSRSISRRGRISPGTRRMVLHQMKELGYTPNLNAQRLAVGRSYTVALHFSDSPLLPDMYLMELVRGIVDALQAQDYGLLLNGQQDALSRWARSRAVDGVIVVGGNPRDAAMGRKIAGLGLPCVVMGWLPFEGIAGAGSVVIDLGTGAREVARMLVQRGHRRIGFIGSPTSVPVLPAFREELEALGAPLRDEFVVITGQTPIDGERAMLELLTRPQPPTAVFARTDELAVGALHAAHKIGVRVPDELSLVGHDDVPLAQLTEPPLTTVRINCAAVGRAASAMLFDLMDEPKKMPVPKLVQTELVLRETVAPLSAI